MPVGNWCDGVMCVKSPEQLCQEAAAVISEEISPEGHTATVGLLLHKPVIIGAVHATRRLSDGVQVSVDCARGIVQVMPQ